MTAILKQFNFNYIHDEIKAHPAWFGNLSGLKAEKMLRGSPTPYLFILRAGETQDDYYITFNHPDGSVRHHAFNVQITSEGWHYENMSARGPFTEATVDDIAFLIIHCKKGECTPFNQMIN